MGWWREGSDLIGDTPADEVSLLLADLSKAFKFDLAILLGAIDGALARNATQFVNDPGGVRGLLGAVGRDGSVVWQADHAPNRATDHVHSAIEAIAATYRSNSRATLPSISELLGTFSFVLAGRVPHDVHAEDGFDLRRICYHRSTNKVLTDIAFPCLEKTLSDYGLKRDADATSQPDPPRFATWTRHPDFKLEVDWIMPPDEKARVEIRGRDTPKIVSKLIAACGASPVAEREDALTDLLTVPKRSSPANPSAANARWDILCSTIINDDAADHVGGKALIRAGLADSDWRCRMAAIWAIGHMRIPGLAAETEVATVPKASPKLFSQEDRRALLALRDLAAARSAGMDKAIKPSADPEFIADIEGLLDSRPNEPRNRPALLLAALLKLDGVDQSGIPAAWRNWME